MARARKLDLTNVAAIDLTISALIADGKLSAGEIDRSRIIRAVTLARACDVMPDNASLWREYRAAEATLFEVREGATDAEAELVAGMSTPVGDTKNTRTPHTRTSVRRSR
jgi:hypothetical protein